MCNYSICAVSKGLFPLSVPHLFIWGAETLNTQITCVVLLCLLTEGCPGLCNSNGRCTLDQNGWHCVCQPGWRGAGCDVAMETLCTDSKDNEGGKRRGAGKRACARAQVYKFSWVRGYLLQKKKKKIWSPQVRLTEKCMSADRIILLPVFPETNARLLSFREKAR